MKRSRNAAALAIALGGSACANSPKSHWVEIGVATDGTKAFVDTGSLTQEKDQSRLTQRFVFADETDLAPALVEQEVIYLCLKGEVITLKSFARNKSGKVVQTEEIRHAAPAAVVPGSVPELIMDAVC